MSRTFWKGNQACNGCGAHDVLDRQRRLLLLRALLRGAVAIPRSDLCGAAGAGITGAITGRAIYEGTLNFAAGQRLADEMSGG